MDVDDLMAVWRTQDAAPLHGVNETLLRLALREDEAKLLKERRATQRLVYGASAFFFALMVLCLVIVMAGGFNSLDVVITLGGAAAILFWPAYMSARARAQARREEKFGASLRDQISRHITQLDDQAEKLASPGFRLANNVPVFVWSVAFFLLTLRVNGEPLDAVWTDPETRFIVIATAIVCAACVAVSIWLQQRWVERDLMPRKRRLEALLAQFD